MRQYGIWYLRTGMADYKRLVPLVESNLYDRTEIDGAIKYMESNPAVQGIAVKYEDEVFNIMSFDQQALAPLSFAFDEVVINEPLDNMAVLKKAGL